MANPQVIFQKFQQSLPDFRLSSDERRELLMQLAQAGMARAQRDALVSQLFELAQGQLGKGKDPAVMAWLRSATQILHDSMESPEDEGKAFFSPGPDCLGTILHAIGTARRQLDICVFTISDDRIKNAILMRKEMGTKVRILTDNEKLLDEGSDIAALDKAGIQIKVDRTTNHMHHKYALFDNRMVITGSYNWTRSAEAFNHENILVSENPIIISRFTSNFEKLWKEMKPF
jgi:phosphatidylserine/phosphatidylglycerophosphate/cardiolipin synthase-like enzyme